jgi:NADH dehydrogenase [ubiquinone] 1 alpha subcomplex assembly factor 7
MTLAEYMTECLLHPDLGYYTRKDPAGPRGGFHHRARDLARCSGS